MDRELVYTVEIMEEGKRTIELELVADGYISEAAGMLPIRWFRLANRRRVEMLVSPGRVFTFTKERQDSVDAREEATSGHPQ